MRSPDPHLLPAAPPRPEPDLPAADHGRRLIQETLEPHLPELARCRSTRELLAHPLHRQLEPDIRRILDTPAIGTFAGAPPLPSRPRYRFLAWNLERGIQLDGQLEAFRTHPYLKACDVLLLTETDVGMARSGNRDVARTLAEELGMHYAFAPSYLNLMKGAGVERRALGENQVGLHGNAILSRYPLRRVRPIHLTNGTDKMAGREKRLGRKTALAAEIELPNLRLAAAAVHLDAQSTQAHRRDQMGEVLRGLDPGVPALLGGDWNTCTYNSSRAFPAIAGFWLRVLMGVDHVIRNHYLHPQRRFDRRLFDLLESSGFDYRSCNRMGERTISYDVGDLKASSHLREWVPSWCFAFIRWALRNHGGQCPFKLDWFASRGLECRDPVILHELREGRGTPLSDHDPIGIDVLAGP